MTVGCCEPPSEWGACGPPDPSEWSACGPPDPSEWSTLARTGRDDGWFTIWPTLDEDGWRSWCRFACATVAVAGSTASLTERYGSRYIGGKLLALGRKETWCGGDNRGGELMCGAW